MMQKKNVKRIGALICLLAFALTMSMSVAFAASELKIDQVSPKDGAEDMAMENMGYKVYFNQEVYKNKKKNAKLCTITDNKGKKVPTIVVVNPKEKNVMMVLADTNSRKTKIKGKTKYTLTIKPGFKADSGQALGQEFTASFKTLNPSTSMWVSMGMMGVMVVAMVFFSTREMKKQNEKDSPQKHKEKTVNPYKEAKRTGKSVEEIVAAEEKKKAKQKAKRERQKQENKKEIASSNIRVSKKRAISEVGLTYKEPKPAKADKPQAKPQAKKGPSGSKQRQHKNKKKK